MMKRFEAILVVLGLICASVLTSNAKETGLGVWSKDYLAPQRSPAMDSEGKFHKVFSWGQSATTQQVFYTESDHLLREWTTPTLALADMKDEGGGWLGEEPCPIMFIGDQNRYHCILNQVSGNNYQFFYMKSDDEGKTWSYPPSGLSASVNEAFNSDFMTSGTHVYFIWDDDRGGSPGWSYVPVIYFRCSYDNGDTWETEYRLSPAGGWYPKIVMDSRGTLHANWQDSKDGAAEQYYSFSTDRGKTWAPEIRITEDDDIVSELSEMLVGPDDRIHLFWLDQRPPNNADNPGIYHSMSVGQAYNGAEAWTPPEKISDFTPPFISSGGKGKTKAVEYHFGTPAVCVRDGIMHLLWANYKQVETPGQPLKDISYLFWCYSRNGGDTWSSPNCIDNVESNSAIPRAYLYNNTLALFWRDDRTGVASTWVKFLDKRKSWPHDGANLAHTRYFDSPCTATLEGLFWPKACISSNVQYCLTEDIDSDGLLDLAAVDDKYLTLYDEWGNVLWQVDPIKDAGLNHESAQMAPMIDIADVDGDTWNDVVVSIMGALTREDGQTTAILMTYSGNGVLGKIIDTGIPGVLSPMNSFDIDDDSRAEIVCAVESSVTSGGLVLFNGEDGSLYGRIKTEKDLRPKVVSDINNDGDNEIVCQGSDNEAHVFAQAFDINLLPLWTCPLGSGGNVILSDMPTGNPPDKILVTGTFTDAPGADLRLAICDGTTGDIEDLTSPILHSKYKGDIASADLDGDNNIEIACTTTTDTVGLFSLETLDNEKQSTDTLLVRCLADINGDGEIEIIGNSGAYMIVLDHNLNLIRKINTLAPIDNIIASDFGTDNVNDIIVRTSSNLQVWSLTSLDDIAKRLRNHLLGIESFKGLQLSAADFNNDDKVDVADLITILWIMSK